jgi:hypothetical protein
MRVKWPILLVFSLLNPLSWWYFRTSFFSWQYFGFSHLIVRHKIIRVLVVRINLNCLVIIIHVTIWWPWAVLARLRPFGFIHKSCCPLWTTSISWLHIFISIVELHILSLYTFSWWLMLSNISVPWSSLSVVPIGCWLKAHILVFIFLIRHAWLFS